jgi:signal transduction histidine kinase
LVNAVEHNDKEEPRVEVTVQEDEETATVRVADNGPGIPDEKKETVFDQGATGRTSGGVGFGLYYVEAMVSEYGGEVRVEDNTPEGTVFVMELPKAEQKKEDTGERNIKMKTDMEQGGKGETDGGKKSDRRKTED